MTNRAWVDEALQNTRLAHRFFLVFAVTATSYFSSSVLGNPPRWSREFRSLELHRAQIVDTIHARVTERQEQPQSLGLPLLPTQVCVHSNGETLTLQEWEQTTLRVHELQSLDRVDVLIPVLDEQETMRCVQIDALDVDCHARQVLVEADHPLHVKLESQPLLFSIDGLTDMTGHPGYSAVKDATTADALKIVELESRRSRTGDSAGLPVISTASLTFVGLMLIALMLHLIAHLNRLREMAEAGHAGQMLGFPWIVTMNSRRARFAIDVISVSFGVCPIVLAAYDYSRSELTYSDHYPSPGVGEVAILLLALAIALWFLRSQVRLQLALPIAPQFYAKPPTTLRDCGTLPLRIKPFVGRTRELAQLAEATSTHIVLTGDDGVGKSAIACEYGRRWQTDYPDGVFLIDCTRSIPAALATLGQVALELGLDAAVSPAERARMVLHKLANRSCLLIYDNVSDMGEALEWLPPHGHVCRILVTSVAEDWSPFFQRVEVSVLTLTDTQEWCESAGLSLAIAAVVHQRTGGNARKIADEIARVRRLQHELDELHEPGRIALGVVASLDARLTEQELITMLDGFGLGGEAIDAGVAACRRFGLLGDAPDLVVKRLVAANPEIEKLVAAPLIAAGERIEAQAESNAAASS